MRHYFGWRRAALVGAGALLIAASVTAARAITDTKFKYTTPQVGYVPINNMAMVPVDSTVANAYSNPAGGGLTNSVGTGCFNTSVHLPNGALINQLVVWYQSGAASDPAVSLIRTTNSSGASVLLVSQSIPNDAAARRQANFPVTASAESTVDNSKQSYGFQVCLGMGDQFYSARIRYTYTSAGD